MPKLGKSSTAYLGTLLTLLTIAVLTISVIILVRVFSTSSTPATDDYGSSNNNFVTTSTLDPLIDSNVVNLAAPPTLTPNTTNEKLYQAYSSYAEVLKGSLMPKTDPCDDFYQFACGGFSKGTNFADMQNKNYDVLAKQLNNRAYIDGYQIPKVIKQVSAFFSQCVQAKTNWPSYIDSGQIIKRKLANLESILGVSFPMLDSSVNSTANLNAASQLPNATVFAKTLAYLSSEEYVDTLLTPYVWPNIKNRDSKHSYEFHILQPQLVYGDNYYIKYWEDFHVTYANKSTNFIKQLAQAYGLNNLDINKLSEGVAKMAQMEYHIATAVNTPVTHRTNYTRVKATMSIAQASAAYPQIDWLTFFTSLSAQKPIKLDPDYQFVVNDPAVFTRLFHLLNSSSIEPETIYNYFYFRLLWEYADYIPSSKQNSTILSKFLKTHSFEISNSNPKSNLLGGLKFVRQDGVTSQWLEDVIAQNSSSADKQMKVQRICARETMYLLPAASGRVFLDAVMPDVKQRADLKNNIGQIVANVLSALEGMVMKLDWMSSWSKLRIAQKAKNLVRNIAYPNFITDNDKLNGVYSSLDINPDSEHNDYVAIKEKIRLFDNDWMAKAVFDKGGVGVDRAEFVLPTVIVNAMFMYNLNSITLPLGILQEPCYNPDYPTAVNYGALGALIGHELAHALDIYGIQFDGVGIMGPNLDDESRVGYEATQQCLVEEYNTFKPSNQLWSVDGAQTLPENFADNAGLRAAYTAFSAYRAYFGQEPRLPDQMAGVFDHDQLFFLSFAQIWCQNVPDDSIKNQLLTDVHSPGKYRIIGSIRNFPAFRSAFNCPVGSCHAPAQHCNVLASQSRQYVGVPPMTTTLPSPNIQLKSQSQSVKFAQAANNFERSIDLSYDPCTNFYDYSCAKFEGPMSFDKSDDVLIAKTIDGLNRPVSRQDSPPVQQVKKLYKQCLVVHSNWTRYTEHGTLVKAALSRFKTRLGWDFPTFSPNNEYNDWPDKFDIGQAAGYLAGVEGVSTLVTSFVDTDWGNSQLSRAPYKLFFDQSRLAMPRKFYVGKVWDMFSAGYRASILHLFTTYGQLMNVTVATDVMAKDIDDVVQLEWILANNFTTDAVTRRDFNRSYNVMDVGQAYKTTKFLNLRAFTTSLLNYADEKTLLDMVQKDNWYKVIVMEPGQIAKLNTHFLPGNLFGFTGRQLINYFFYRLLRSKKGYLPAMHDTNHTETLEMYAEHWPEAASPSAKDLELVHRVGEEHENKDLGKGRGKSSQDTVRKEPFRNEQDFFEIAESINNKMMGENGGLSGKNYTKNEVNCIFTSTRYMNYASARVLLDEMLPKEEDRTMLKAKAQEIIENVIVGFRSMIDQLSWMSYQSKLGAYSKMDELVRNVAYPDFVTNNTGLSAYYHKLNFHNDQSFFAMLKDLDIFYYQRQWALLNYDQPNADRTRFGTPGITNAWYNPTMNSITFPLGILQQPFFDADWPTSVNYGALGLVAGHELTHGFDDHGIQWNGIGVLQQWIDDDSKAAFRRMADCIVDEYSSFCPLDAGKYHPSCIDGHHTQGENIADNGGMIAAFRAYRNVIAYGGEEQLLPGPLAGQYTHDQLFFLSFAQVWCEKEPSAESLHSQFLYDPHSPSRYRVLGSVQNFPAFRNAFNCPPRPVDASPPTCDVYVTQPKQITGGPPSTTTTLPLLNIPQPIASSNPVSQTMGQFFEAHMDTTQNPCDNFYEYTCNNYKFLPSFYLADLECVYHTEIGLLSITSDDPRSLQQARLFYDRCIYDDQHPEVEYNITKGNYKFKQLYNKFRIQTELAFPLLNTATKANKTSDDGSDDGPSEEDLNWPNMSQLGFALGLLSSEFDVDTLVSYYVDTNWAAPESKQPYALYLDQPSLFEDAVVYTTPLIWQSFKPRYKNYIMALFDQFSRVMHVHLAKEDIEKAADQILYFEYCLAANFSTRESQRRNYSRLYNPIDFNGLFSWDEKKLSSISMSDYAFSLLQIAPKEVVQRYLYEKSKFVVMELEQLFKLDKALKDKNVYGFQPEHLLNYLYFRLLDRIARYFSPLETLRSPDLFNSLAQLHEVSPLKSRFKPVIGKPLMQEDFLFKYLPLHTQIQRDQTGLATAITFDSHFYCAHNTRILLPFAAGRAFVDQIYPTKKHKRAIKRSVGKMVDQVISAFQGMLSQLEWMSEATKEAANNKLQNMVRNIAYPDFIVDDVKLDAYHADLNLSSAQNGDEMFHELLRFYTTKSLAKLGESKGTDRTDWGMGPAVVNAWFQPQLGSITFPAAILTPPFFSIYLPSAANYAFGAIVGHELTHGFDDEGVQFDGVGKLHNWMDAPSTTAFKNMAQCVVDQYAGFCPHGGPFCLNGVSTQGENIADNGGIRAALRAYHNSLGLNGVDQTLPGQLISQFSGDQLFFLSFVQTWCSSSGGEGDLMSILLDPHSPSKYRVLGTLQNYPAFRNAFNCPATSLYSQKKCDVWITDVKTVTGIPPTTTTIPELNIPARQRSNSSKYLNASELIEQSVDNTQDPCNNFYGYTCNNDLRSEFSKMDLEALVALAKDEIKDDNEAIYPLEQAKAFFRQCVDFSKNWRQIDQSEHLITTLLQQFSDEFGFFFPAYNQTYQPTWPNASELSRAIGFLSGRLFANSLLSDYVDTHWKEPESTEQPYILFIDQATTLMDPLAYHPRLWNSLKDDLLEYIHDLLELTAEVLGHEVTSEQMKQASQEIVDMDYIIATQLNTNESLRRGNFDRNFNFYTIEETQQEYGLVDWKKYFSELVYYAPAEVQDIVNKMDGTGFGFSLMEPEALLRLQKVLKQDNDYGFTPRQLGNYLYFVVIWRYSDIIVPPAKKQAVMQKKMMSYVHRVHPSKQSPRTHTPSSPSHWLSKQYLYGNDENVTSKSGITFGMTEVGCASSTLNNMDVASGRLYIDHILPDVNGDRQRLKQTASKMLNGVLLGFRSMIDQLPWMSAETKRHAYSKMEGIVVNVGYPDMMTNNQQIIDHYSVLNFTLSDTYHKMLNELNKFSHYQSYAILARKGGIRRDNFNGVVAVANAWYQPQLNSITLPLAILQQPMFDPDWPAAVNLGGLGTVLGHELTHGFDNMGIQWDANGTLNHWMDQKSIESFNKMAQCVVDEYNGFCPLSAEEFQPNCLDGVNTLGENIADSGGIHAAYRAYRHSLDVNGPDQALPGDLVGQYSHDQLFFLSFAKLMCDHTNNFDEWVSILVDVHSPNYYRTLGALRNFPAFQDAFNCPAGSLYSPGRHCNVWVS